MTNPATALRNEQEHLERIAAKSLYAAGANGETVKYSFRVMERYLVGKTLLELGPAEGVMTELLASTGKTMTLVEGSGAFCTDLAQRFPQATVIHSLFEEFKTDQKFDNIILGHVLEHVADPVEILTLARQWLTPETGRIIAAVPNARSLHRQAAVIMGLLSQEDQLNEMDHYHGHRRVFNPESFRSAFTQSGFAIEVFGGYWMKPVHNKHIEDHWTLEMLQAFMRLGERYPDIAGEIYVVGSVKA